jgi:hypothetical protein
MPVIEDRPWDPGHPQHPDLHLEANRLVYVVVDETIEGWVGLSFAVWPHADEAGRLRFPDPAGPVDVGTSVASLQRFLATEESRRGKRRASNGNGSARVEVRVGMTFAARPKRGSAAALLDRLRDDAAHDQVRVAELRAIVTRPVDLTDQGRLLAKLAAYGAFFSTLPKHVGERWRLTDEIQS